MRLTRGDKTNIRIVVAIAVGVFLLGGAPTTMYLENSSGRGPWHEGHMNSG